MAILTEEHLRQWHDDGFFILRDVVDRETVAELRGVVKNMLLTPDPEAAGALTDSEPNQPAETRSFAGRMARYRKHNAPGTTFFPLMWHECIAGAWVDVAVEMAPHLGGGNTGDVLVKFNSSFVKQPSGGAATPWHQDNGLWRDGNTNCFSVWMALDAATEENGCMQFIPGSHCPELREDGIVQHILYNDSIHCELPAERVADLIERNGVVHIELAPGDCVCWHDSLWHYSPPNLSDKGRIGIAAVYTTPNQVEATADSGRLWFMSSSNRNHGVWAMKGGKRCLDFPPEQYSLKGGQSTQEAAVGNPPPHPNAGPRPRWDNSTTISRL